MVELVRLAYGLPWPWPFSLVRQPEQRMAQWLRHARILDVDHKILLDRPRFDRYLLNHRLQLLWNQGISDPIVGRLQHLLVRQHYCLFRSQPELPSVQERLSNCDPLSQLQAQRSRCLVGIRHSGHLVPCVDSHLRRS